MSLTEDVSSILPSVLADLRRLIAIPSVSSLPEHDDDVIAAAELVADLLRAEGCPDVRLLTAGGKPAVYGHYPAPEGAPTVLLYAHYDVQPTGDETIWTTPAFNPTERDGRLYARGSADDKGGIAVHLGAMRAFGGKPPVGVKIFVEGEEEIGSPSMAALLDQAGDLLRADAFVIADAVNWKVGEPALTASLRGVVDAVVRVSTLEGGLHSGQFGGVAPDALSALCRLLATLHDDAGNPAIAGLVSSPPAEVDYEEDRLRAEAGLLDGVHWIGEGSFTDRMWTKPAVSVLAIDATPVRDASNTLVPTARAKVSVRIAPNQDPADAEAALRDHLLSHAPWGARVEVEAGQSGAGAAISLDSDIARAALDGLREGFGVEPVRIGTGGSIPIVAEFADRNPGAPILLTAVVDPTSRMHSDNESLDLADLGKATLAEALFLQKLV